jgi:hypothetical protein
MKVTVWSHLHREGATGLPGAGGTRPGVRDYEAPLISLENSESGLMLRTFNEELHDTTCAVYGPTDWSFVEVLEPPSDEVQKLMEQRKAEHEGRHSTGMHI